MCEDINSYNLKIDFAENLDSLIIKDSKEVDSYSDDIITIKRLVAKTILGKNAQIANIYDVNLREGEYIPTKAVEKILWKKMQIISADSQLINKNTQKVIAKEDFIKEVMNSLKNNSRLFLSFGSKKITNQKTARLLVKGQNDSKFFSKGLLMLGNKFDLAHGDYINKKDLETILSNFYVTLPNKKEENKKANYDAKEKALSYLTSLKEKGTEKVSYGLNRISKMKKLGQGKLQKLKEKALDFITKKKEKYNERKQKYTIKKTRKSWKHKGKMLAAGLAGIATIGLLSGLNVKLPKKGQETVTDYFPYQVTTIKERKEEPVYESEEEMWKKALSKYEVGKETEIEKGVHFYESSDYAFGGANKYGIHETNNYNLKSFSILGNGQILKTNAKEETNLYNLANEIKKEYDINYQDLTYMVNCENVGWVSINEKDNLQNLKPEIISKEQSSFGKVYQSKSFTVGVTTFEIDGENVTLKTSDQYNRPLEKSTIVKASNNKEYEIVNIVKKMDQVQSVIDYEKGLEINWKIKNIQKRKALLLASLSLFGALSGARLLAKTQLTPSADFIAKRKVYTPEK